MARARPVAPDSPAPLYDALEETGLVLAVHEGLGVRGAPTIGRDVSETFAVRHAMSHPMEQMAAMASLMLEGALERHPAMRVAFLESGTGWLPYWLARLDGHAEWMRDTETAGLSLSPSEYFARQCMISTDPDDPLAAWTVSQVGADHVVPSDANAAATIRELTNGLGADVLLDFVGADATIELARSAARMLADVTIVGIAGGSVPFQGRSSRA